MRVTDVTAIPVAVPAEAELRTDEDAAAVDTYDHVIVRVTLADGTVGYGEIAPHPDWPRSGTQTSCRALVTEELASRVEGTDVYRIDRTVERCRDAVADLPYPLAGVDVALHDALGRLLDRPVYDLLGGPAEDDRTIELHYTAGVQPLESFRTAVTEAADAGFKTFKLKVGGGDHAAERARLRVLREAVPDARIRVDANGVWTPAEAIPRLRALETAADGLVFVEQPVAPESHAGLARVREATGIPVLADEACYSPTDAAQLAAVADVLNVKVANAGGLTTARRVATVAAAHGLAGFAGGMLELGIGAAASVHFAVATPVIRYPTGVLNRFATDMLIENDDAWAPDGPQFTVPDGSGLGVTVDTAAIERFRVD